MYDDEVCPNCGALFGDDDCVDEVLEFFDDDDDWD